MKPVVAIVGRANVGKSSLFNRFIQRRRSIVHDTPGVTRDRIFSLASLQDQSFWLVDTGGLEFESSNEIEQGISRQVQLAVQEAQLVLVVMDGREGLTLKDQEVISNLRPFGKPIMVVVNKMDPGSSKGRLEDFYSLGFSPLFSTSAEHGLGIQTLQEAIGGFLKTLPSSPEEKIDNQIRIAFIGRPNVGKSSLINSILKEPRLMVSETPGTTRDEIDIPITFQNLSFLLVDTAGIRKRSKREDVLETFSAVRALQSIDQSEVVVLLLDTVQGITTQDQRIASAVIEKGAGLLLVVNKWDLVSDSENARKEFREEIYWQAPFLQFAPVLFVSAKTGLGVPGILNQVSRVRRNLNRKFSSSELHSLFETLESQRPISSGHKLQFQKVEALEKKIPTLVVYCNRPDLVSPSLRKYFQNGFSQKLKLDGVPLRVWFKGKKKKKNKLLTVCFSI